MISAIARKLHAPNKLILNNTGPPITCAFTNKPQIPTSNRPIIADTAIAARCLNRQIILLISY